MFVGKARDLPWSGAPERCFFQISSNLTTKHYTRLEGLPGTNTLAYYENTQIMVVKKFYVTGVWSIRNINPEKVFSLKGYHF